MENPPEPRVSTILPGRIGFEPLNEVQAVTPAQGIVAPSSKERLSGNLDNSFLVDKLVFDEPPVLLIS